MKATKSLSEDVVIGVSGTMKKGIIKQKMKKRWQKQWYEERKGRWFYKIQRKTAEMRQLNHNLDLGSRLFLRGKSHTGKWDCNMVKW